MHGKSIFSKVQSLSKLSGRLKDEKQFTSIHFLPAPMLNLKKASLTNILLFKQEANSKPASLRSSLPHMCRADKL